jgi:prepilin peptidase CpaA
MRRMPMHVDPGTAAVFLPLVIPIAFWVAWSDLARMRIPNAAVLALVLVYATLGPFVMPLAEWGMGWGRLAVVLAIGFVVSAAGLVGAGDAKFAAASAPFVAFSDLATLAVLFAAILFGAVLAHRGARALPAVRRAVPEWRSWRDPRFPLGLALGPALVIYLALGLVAGAPSA